MIDTKQTLENEGLVLKTEAKELEEAPKEVKFDPVQSASAVFSMYFPIYCQCLEKLSRKQIIRVTKAIVGMPLEETKLNLKDPAEVRAFMLGEKLLQAKMVITHHVLTEKQKESEAKKLEESNVKEQKETS